MSFFRRTPVHKFKQIVLGDTGVGKSTLVARLAGRELPEPQPTVGCEFSALHYPAKNRDPQVDLNQWDCAGQERFTAIIDIYFRDVDVCFLVYDINQPKTLERIFQVWLPRFLHSKYNNRNSPHSHRLFYLIGNKADQCPDYRPGHLPEACKTILKRYASAIEKYRLELWVLSALNSEQIQEFSNSVRHGLLTSLIPAQAQTSNPSGTTEPELLLITRQADKPLTPPALPTETSSTALVLYQAPHQVLSSSHRSWFSSSWWPGNWWRTSAPITPVPSTSSNPTVITPLLPTEAPAHEPPAKSGYCLIV